jgi:hypothetical protein
VIGRSPGQLSGEIDGQVVVLSIDSGYYFHFNAVGSRIWSLLEAPTEAGVLIERILGEFAVDRATCDEQVREFLAELSANRLIWIEP